MFEERQLVSAAFFIGILGSEARQGRYPKCANCLADGWACRSRRYFSNETNFQSDLPLALRLRSVWRLWDQHSIQAQPPN